MCAYLSTLKFICHLFTQSSSLLRFSCYSRTSSGCLNWAVTEFCVISKYDIWLTIPLSTPLMKMRKSTGPRTVPSRTPDVTGIQLLKVWLMQTLWRRPAIQFRIHWAVLPWMLCVMHDLYKKPCIWYLVKYLLKVQVNEVHCFVVTRVLGVNATS